MDSKKRFSDRVDTYVKYRPSYPVEALDYLYDTIGIKQDSVIADIGAGTGIMSELLLARGSKVIAVEPNADMRQAAEKRLSSNPNFRIQPYPAEGTGLDDKSVDAIVCAQSFHWFDQEAARIEFHRVLKPGGKAVLIWNSRLTEGSEFLTEYDQLLHDYGTDYKEVKHTNITIEMFSSFFKEGTLELKEFANRQIFDYEGLRGRLLSSSYSPSPGHPNYEPMMDALQSIFDRTQKEGHVFFDYKTQIFWGEV
ncbi:class I SAM-dependent methyltransferase [Paenibacillus sp. Marseille-Q4541]|uniref:class I SAM-dependent methyltransferase n=1 Tax=Paenibacillus sp. Marseille-Q4541 TaxID=2831522 RepID=UPI001BAD8951|nr:class I SAM-dependent methyltransferase [Paenibacillus sp. Marseille-Q4541]